MSIMSERRCPIILIAGSDKQTGPGVLPHSLRGPFVFLSLYDYLNIYAVKGGRMASPSSALIRFQSVCVTCV